MVRTGRKSACTPIERRLDELLATTKDTPSRLVNGEALLKAMKDRNTVSIGSSLKFTRRLKKGPITNSHGVLQLYGAFFRLLASFELEC